ncbi:mucin-5AC-like isoform X2 [Zootermopsis nevadensis]|uniref:mucin-5AC-like isoform X2 n=1 Tax=Zootermopsis nevadensis TaxID=136037 RepID=UPI000B8EBFCC|nr:mucin-5AC-like isoform X2 [Zootermopsis nevadensis]
MTVLQRSGPMSSTSSLSSSGTPPSGGEHDLLSTASSALRRLHFKSAGGSRANKKHQPSQQPVPKVVIMGSSTTSTSSNNTINTSTDSANTVATMITVTDGETDTDTDKKPINYMNDIVGTSLSLEKDDDFYSGSSTDDSNPVPPPPTPLLGAVSKEQHFIFVRTEVDDEEHTGHPDEETRKISLLKSSIHNNKNIKDGVSTTTTTKSPRSSRRRHHHHRQKTDARSKTNSNMNGHHPPPDLRVDFFSDCFSKPVFNTADKERVFDKNFRRHSIMTDVTTTVDKGRSDKSLAGGSAVLASSSSSSSTAAVLLKKAGVLQGTASTVVGGEDEVLEKTATSSGVGEGTNINIPTSPPKVNTTTNPLGIAGATPLPMRHPTATTIVVQQPSVTGGSPTIATVLLKNCGASSGVGVTTAVTQSGDSAKTVSVTKLQREENMKQLLDVANTLTLQELHDFEMKYGSPHHSRSQSVKTPGSRSNSGRPNYLCLPQQRSRVASMPNTDVEEEYYRLRHFSITGKGVVNRGDSLKSRRSRSNNSVTSSNSSHSTEHLTAGGGAVVTTGGSSYPGSARTSATTSLASSRESSTSNPGPTGYKVVMLGSAGVGKSSLINQFMTSEYLHAYDTSLDDEFGEKSVCVLLDGEESELTFIDHPSSEMSPENCISSYEPHAYCVVYSTVDRASLRCAEEILQCLWKNDTVSSKAVILVGNKTDLVRSRTVPTEEGKNMATSYDCKFIETSVGINHNVDELLVGILTQIRLKLENPERARDLFRKRSCSRKKNRNKSPLGGSGGHKPYRGSRTSTSLKVKGLLGKVWARDSKSKSCENLHVL